MTCDVISDRASAERFQEAESTGADVLMTSCPACLMQFQQIAQPPAESDGHYPAHLGATRFAGDINQP